MSRIGRPRGSRNKATVSRWELTPAEARVMDAYIAHPGDHRAAAKAAGVALRTYQNVRVGAVRRFGGDRITALTLWREFRASPWGKL